MARAVLQVGGSILPPQLLPHQLRLLRTLGLLYMFTIRYFLHHTTSVSEGGTYLFLAHNTQQQEAIQDQRAALEGGCCLSVIGLHVAGAIGSLKLNAHLGRRSNVFQPNPDQTVASSLITCARSASSPLIYLSQRLCFRRH